MKDEKQKKGKERRTPITWGRPDSPIITANVFRFIYNPEAIVFAIAAVDPELTLPEEFDPKRSIRVVPSQRYLLTISDFIRLKKEIEEAYEGLKKQGLKI